MKECIKCNNELPFKNFYKYSNGNYRGTCKKCIKENYYTLEYKIVSIFNTQISSSKKRGHNPPEYSKEEFIDWCLNSERFQRFYIQWKENDFLKSLAPSIDRNDDYLPYSFENIRVCTWIENNLKANEDRKNGINNKVSKSINQICLATGKLIENFYSIKQAARKLKLNDRHISECARGNRKQVGGYKWEY